VYEQNPYYLSNSSKQHHSLSAREETAYETFTIKVWKYVKAYSAGYEIMIIIMNTFIY